MKHSLDRVEELAVKLRTLKPLSKENQQKLDKKFRLEFNFNSNHMEGNTLTYGETELLLIFDDTRGNHSMREYEEMKAHDTAYLLVEEWARDKERPLTEQNIKNLNEIILVRPFWKDAITPDGKNTRRQIKVGNYKEYPNSVRLQNGEMFHYASPAETPIMMQELIDWYRAEESSSHPVTLAAMLHYKFVRIHPFDDGNGRIARLLMNYVLLKNDLPPVIIKSKDKANYLRALHAADIDDFETFIKYISEQVEWSLEVSIKSALGQSIEEPEDWEKELVLLKQELGQSKDTKIQKTYGKESLQKIYETSIEPLAILWEEKLKKFDSLFNGRKCLIEIITQSPERDYDASDNSFSLGLKKLWNKVMSIGEENIKKLKIVCYYEILRTKSSVPVFHAGTIEFGFHNHAYDIQTAQSDEKMSLLYDEFLAEEDIQNIANLFSRNLMQSIKEATI